MKIPKLVRNLMLLVLGAVTLKIFAILLNLSVWDRVVFGPASEELLKLLALLFLVVTVGRIRNNRDHLVAAATIGVAFGVYEHFMTYSDEIALTFILRLAAHPAYMFVGWSTYRVTGNAYLWVVAATALHGTYNWTTGMPFSFLWKMAIIILAFLLAYAVERRGPRDWPAFPELAESRKAFRDRLLRRSNTA